MTMLFWLFAIYGWILAMVFAGAYIYTYRALQRAFAREADYHRLIVEHRITPSLAALKTARIIAPLVLILLLPAISTAQTAPIVFGNVVDAISTEYVLAHAHAREWNPIMGQQVARRIAVKTIGTVAEAWLVQRIARRHPKVAKGLGYGFGIAYSSVAVYNLRVLR